jgi:hypothetical protein
MEFSIAIIYPPLCCVLKFSVSYIWFTLPFVQQRRSWIGLLFQIKTRVVQKQLVIRVNHSGVQGLMTNRNTCQAGGKYKNSVQTKYKGKRPKKFFGRFAPCTGGGSPIPPSPYLLLGDPDNPPLAGHQIQGGAFGA